MGFQTCKYRKNESGEIESQMFDSDDIPEGWVDSPADLANGSDPLTTEEALDEAIDNFVEDVVDKAVDEALKEPKKKSKKRGK